MGRFRLAYGAASTGLVTAIILGLGGTAGAVHAQPPARSTTHRQATGARVKSCASKSKPRGSITFSDFQFPDTLNPYQYSQPISRQIINAMFTNLFRYDSNARLMPQMAAVIPTVGNGGIKNGGKTIVLRLKPGLRWSNGSEITSHAIKFGWQVEMDGATGPACLGTCDAIRSIDTPSKYVAVLHLRGANSSAVPEAVPQPWPTVWPGAWNHSAHAAALKLGADPNYTFEGLHYPTDGPYQVAKVVSGSRIVLRPMPYYSGPNCGSRAGTLTFQAYGSVTDMIGAAAARKTDVTSGYGLADLPDLMKHASAFQVRVHTNFAFEHLEFNVDKTYQHKLNPLANQNVRLALALALNKYGVIRDGLAVSSATARQMAAWSPFVDAPDLKQPFVTSHLSGQWDPIAHAYVIPGTASAVAHARTLLSRTPFKKGFTLDLYTTLGSPSRLAQELAIASSWRKLGVTVAPNYVTGDALLGSWGQGGIIAHGNFQVAMFAYVGSPDPEQYRYNLQSAYCDRMARVHSTLNGNGSCVRDPAIDRAFNGAAQTFNPVVRAADYAAVQNAVNQRAYWVPLYFDKTVSTNDGRVANFSINPTLSGPTWNIDAWKVRS